MRVRPARPDDAAAIAAIYAPHVTDGVISFELVAPDAAETARRMTASPRHPWLVACEDGSVLAYAYAAPFATREAYRWAVETTIYVADEAQGRGVGRSLYSALLATLKAQGFTQALARIALPNPASTALHQALGFRAVGVEQAVGWKVGRWIDVALWQRPLATPADPPDPPAPSPRP